MVAEFAKFWGPQAVEATREKFVLSRRVSDRWTVWIGTVLEFGEDVIRSPGPSKAKPLKRKCLQAQLGPGRVRVARATSGYSRCPASRRVL